MKYLFCYIRWLIVLFTGVFGQTVQEVVEVGGAVVGREYRGQRRASRVLWRKWPISDVGPSVPGDRLGDESDAESGGHQGDRGLDLEGPVLDGRGEPAVPVDRQDERREPGGLVFRIQDERSVRNRGDGNAIVGCGLMVRGSATMMCSRSNGRVVQPGIGSAWRAIPTWIRPARSASSCSSVTISYSLSSRCG